jgi:hypothetical protein
MQAMQVHHFGGPEVLVPVDVPDPITWPDKRSSTWRLRTCKARAETPYRSVS